jgi:predicted glycoside hydrolase/deacetylase ChbG (UPF0249 family)
LREEDIYRETKAQITRLQDGRFEVMHLDTHKHAHVFPSVFRPLLRAAADCGVRAVRNPFEPVRALAWGAAWRRRGLWARYLPVRMLRAFAEDFEAECRKLGLTTPQGTFGIALTGFADRDSLFSLLNRIPQGTWEMVCHPAYEDDLWHALGTRPGAGARELELLLSPAFRDCIRDNEIVLSSYTDLCASSRVARPASAPVVPVLDGSAAPAT